MVWQSLPLARAATHPLPSPKIGLSRNFGCKTAPLATFSTPSGLNGVQRLRARPRSKPLAAASDERGQDSEIIENSESAEPEIQTDRGASVVGEEEASGPEDGEVSVGLAEAKTVPGSPVILLTENKVRSASSFIASVPLPVKYGAAGVGAFAILMVMGAGVWSLWTHKDDKNLRLEMKRSMKDMVEKMEQLKEEHEDEVRKITWEYSSKLSAKESEARATERQVKDKMSKDFAQKLAKEVRVREKEVSEALTTKYRAEMSKADAQWETKLQLQRVEIAKLREAGGEASAELEKQKRSLLVSKQKYLKREEEFEKKAIKYSKAISAVAPGGTVDTLEQKVTVLNNQIRLQERELKKLNQTLPSSSQARNGVKTLESVRMVAGATIIPSIYKEDSGGEDAFFVCSKGYGAIGVADGVGGWAEDGVDPALYPKKFMDSCSQMYTKSSGSQPPPALEVLLDAYGKAKMPGSATVAIAALSGNGDLEMTNVGDCGIRIVRNGEIVFATKSQIHEFNMPYQLGCATYLEETDYPSDANIYHFQVRPGDVVVAGSDGLFDNVFDKDLAALVDYELKSEADNKNVQLLSKKIATVAHENAQNESLRTPWAVESAAAGQGTFFSRFLPQGGKMDDCTVVVGLVEA